MFTQKTLNFLAENRFMNSKEWFIEHKDEYSNYVLKPLAELASSLAPVISSIDGLIITEPKVDKTISRIYRDVRFSKDKLLYREEMWLSFKRDRKAFPNYPEFFFVVMQKEILYGCGYYSASAETMNTIRELILNKNPMFIKALKAYENQNIFDIDGDKYKKSQYADYPENIRTWLDRKTICFIRRSNDFSMLYSDDLPQMISDDYRQMDDVYNFFIYAEIKSQEDRVR